ncbi:hypothetical protein D3C80_2218450 [compost metagenome]
MICVAYADAARRGSPAIKMSTTMPTTTITTMNTLMSTTMNMAMSTIIIMPMSRARRAP